MDKIQFTCIECGKKELTEADGLEMKLGFVCTPCLYATSEPVPSNEHPMEKLFPNGLTAEEADNIQGMTRITNTYQKRWEKETHFNMFQKTIIVVVTLLLLVLSGYLYQTQINRPNFKHMTDTDLMNAVYVLDYANEICGDTWCEGDYNYKFWQALVDGKHVQLYYSRLAGEIYRFNKADIVVIDMPHKELICNFEIYNFLDKDEILDQISNECMYKNMYED